MFSQNYFLFLRWGNPKNETIYVPIERQILGWHLSQVLSVFAVGPRKALYKGASSPVFQCLTWTLKSFHWFYYRTRSLIHCPLSKRKQIEMVAIVAYAFIFLLTLLFSYIFIKKNTGIRSEEPHDHEKSVNLPPGSLGWPYIGETLQLYSQDPNTFFSARQKRHVYIYTYSLFSRSDFRSLSLVYESNNFLYFL